MKKLLELLLLILLGAFIVFMIAAVITGTVAIFKLAVLALVTVLSWSKFWAVMGAVGITLILSCSASSTVNK